MVILLVAHHVYVAVEFISCEALLRRAEVLSHVDRGAVAAKQEFAVESVGCEVAPYAAVGILNEDTHVESLLHQALAEQIGIVLIVNLVETDSKGLVGLVEAGEDPAVHHFPELADFRIAFLPFKEHLVHLLVHGRIFLLELGIGHVAVTHEVVALYSGAFRGGAVHALLPCVHALADVHAAVIHQSNLYNLVARRGQQTAHRISKEIVAHVAEVQGLVGIGRRELHHHRFAGAGKLAVVFRRDDSGEAFLPEQVAQVQVKEALYTVISGDFGAVLLKPGAYCSAGGIGSCVRDSQQREHHKGIVTLEFLPGDLNLHLIRGDLRSVQGLNCF